MKESQRIGEKIAIIIYNIMITLAFLAMGAYVGFIWGR